MDNYNSEEIWPVSVFILIPFFFIILIIFTDYRYKLRPVDYIDNATVCASLILGFIFLYGMQKYDQINVDTPTFAKNIIYLQRIANKYDASLTKYLKCFLKGYLNFEEFNFSILTFQEKLLPQITNPNEVIHIQGMISGLEILYNTRISKTDLVANEIWASVLIVAILFTVIFPMDPDLSRLNACIIIILIWLPLFVLYYLYTKANKLLISTIQSVLREL